MRICPTCTSIQRPFFFETVTSVLLWRIRIAVLFYSRLQSDGGFGMPTGYSRQAFENLVYSFDRMGP